MDALFRIKLQIPVVQQNLSSRIRIEHELNEGLGARLTMVTAPAGYGKTTAVAKWTRQLDMPVAWFSIDSLDNSLKRFWSYFIAALENIIPGLEKRFSQYLNTANDITGAGIVTPLIDEIYQYSNNFVLIMDDYHFIEEDSIHESVALLLKYLPENAHLVIISRIKLPYNSVRLQTLGYIKEINLYDLQFTTEEIAGLCKAKGIYATVREVIDLEKLTEGWAAGVYLLLDSADKDRSSLSAKINSFHSEQQLIASYLSEEIIKQWGQAERDFMLKTSILHSLTGQLCDCLTGGKDGGKMLESLSDRNAFIIKLDDEGRWYRYHHLFAEFLQKKLDSLNADKNTLHCHAGAWYESKGYFQEAIEHYLQGGHYEKAAGIIELKGREILKTGVVDILIGWFDVLPRELIEDSDILCLTYAWALIIMNNEKEAMYWINKVEGHLQNPSAKLKDEDWSIQLQVEVVSAKGFIELKKQNLMNTTQSIMKFKEIMHHGSIFLMSGINFIMEGASIISGIFGLKGHLHIVEKEYMPIYERIRSIIKVPGGYIPTLMAEILFERNMMDEAVAMLVKGSMEAENNSTVGCVVPLTITYAKVLKSRGDIKGAYAVVRDGAEKLRKLGGIHLLPILSAFETRMNLETGDHQAVDSWMKRNCLDIFDNPNLNNIFEYFTFARVLMARKEYDNCLLLLNKIELFAQQENNLLYTLEVRILLAIVYYFQGHTQKSMDILRQALVIGETNGYERIFIEEGVHMAALLERFARNNYKQVPHDKTDQTNDENNTPAPSVSPVYVRRLLSFTRDYCIAVKVFATEKAKTASGPAVKNIWLTKREKDIIHLLDSELTNAEIAYTLGISINTIKVNCTNIYRKLEVKNREQAVRAAKNLIY